MYCWRDNWYSRRVPGGIDSVWHFSTAEPRRVEEDEPWRKLIAGDIEGAIGNVIATMPEDLWQFLPAAGEVRELDFHKLWGQAQELPSYDKKHWVNLQQMLGE